MSKGFVYLPTREALLRSSVPARAVAMPQNNSWRDLCTDGKDHRETISEDVRL